MCGKVYTLSGKKQNKSEAMWDGRNSKKKKSVHEQDTKVDLYVTALGRFLKTKKKFGELFILVIIQCWLSLGGD